MYCDGVIVSPTQIITWECDHYGSTPVSLFMNRKKVVEDFLFGVIQFPSRRISKPNWRRLNNDYEILTLDKPIKSSKKHAPICVDGAIRREYLPSLIYFNWKQKYHLDGERAIMAVVHYQQISRDGKFLSNHKPCCPSFPNCCSNSKLFSLIVALYPTSALSYMKDGKFHFAGIISMNKNSKVEKYVPFEGSTLREMVTAN